MHRAFLRPLQRLALLVLPALLLACGEPNDADSPAVVAPASASPPSAGCGRVTVASMNWHSAELLAQVDQFVLSKGYGCEVELVAGDTVPTITAMIETGQPDLAPETWIDGVRPPLQAAVDEGRIFLASRALQDGGTEGWWIPRHVAQAHPEIKTIEDALNRPDLFRFRASAASAPEPPASPQADPQAGLKTGPSAGTKNASTKNASTKNAGDPKSASAAKGAGTPKNAGDPKNAVDPKNASAPKNASDSKGASGARSAKAAAPASPGKTGAKPQPAAQPNATATAGANLGTTPVSGTVHSCPGSWSCHRSTSNAFKAWNADKRGFVLLEADSPAQLDASLDRAHETQAGWLGYHWSPSPAVGRYDLVRLDAGVSFDAQAYQACMLADPCETPARTDWPTSDVFTVVGKRLHEQGGPVWSYLSRRSWTRATVNGLLAWMVSNRASSADAARHFLKTQPEIWRDWVSPEAAEKIAAAL